MSFAILGIKYENEDENAAPSLKSKPIETTNLRNLYFYVKVNDNYVSFLDEGRNDLTKNNRDTIA